MKKEDLNRQFGAPDRQIPISPPDLLVAAHLIRDHCNTTPRNGCKECIFHGERSCALFEYAPDDWELSGAEHRTVEWIDKQYFNGSSLFTDTDK
jgi:hypothetical protein